MVLKSTPSRGGDKGFRLSWLRKLSKRVSQGQGLPWPMVLTLKIIGDNKLRGEGKAKEHIQDYTDALDVKMPKGPGCFQLCMDGSEAQGLSLRTK